MPRKINRLEAVATIGIEIGKNTFHLVGFDSKGAIVLRHKLWRSQVEGRLVTTTGDPILSKYVGHTRHRRTRRRRTVDRHNHKRRVDNKSMRMARTHSCR